MNDFFALFVCGLEDHELRDDRGKIAGFGSLQQFVGCIWANGRTIATDAPTAAN